MRNATPCAAFIAKATYGELWMGGRLPHHFRNWNWIMVGMGQPLLSLAIEGEKGYDPRVYKLAVQIARDYLTYAITGKGFSTEAVGYTQFGLVWGDPFMVAAARRGDNLLVQNHHRAMLDWYHPYPRADASITGPAMATAETADPPSGPSRCGITSIRTIPRQAFSGRLT